MKKDRIEIKKTNLHNSITDQLMNLVDFIHEHPDANLMYIADSGEEDSTAVTGCIGTKSNIKKMMIGLCLTTIKSACNDDLFEVFLFLHDVTAYVIDHLNPKEDKELCDYFDKKYGEHNE